MSGEKSKSSGDFGEKIASRFLEVIGWIGVENNITVECVSQTEHADDGKKRKTHGIDKYYRYKSQLMKSNTQEDVLISVKHTIADDGYGTNPTRMFKKHLKSLSFDMECFKYDKDYASRKLPSNIHERNLSGVIFWVSQRDDDDTDIISKVCNFNNTDKIDFGPIYLLDNNKINFLNSAISFAKETYEDYSFEYHKTGFNNNPAEFQECGKKLPVQLINTNILPIRFRRNSQNNVAIFLNEPFSETSLNRTVGFSKLLTRDWPEEIHIYYSDYNELFHSNVVESVKGKFSDDNFKEKIEVRTFTRGIASLGGK